MRGYWRAEVIAPAALAIWPGRRHAGVAAMLQSIHSEHPCGLRSDCAVLGNAADHLYFRRIQEKADGNDDVYVVSSGKQALKFDETKISDVRTLAINYPAGTNEISIYGTHVVPEFPISILVLVIALIPTIFFSRKIVR